MSGIVPPDSPEQHNRLMEYILDWKWKRTKKHFKKHKMPFPTKITHQHLEERMLASQQCNNFPARVGGKRTDTSQTSSSGQS